MVSVFKIVCVLDLYVIKFEYLVWIMNILLWIYIFLYVDSLDVGNKIKILNCKYILLIFC